MSGWVIVHVTSGTGYWMHQRTNHELDTGAVLLVSDQIQGCIRASQVGGMRLHCFRVEPGKLTGMVTLSEQTFLQNAARDEKLSSRILPPNPQISERFNKLKPAAGNNFPARAQALLLFLEIFGGNFEQPQPEPAAASDAGMRLQQTLNQMPVSELIDLSFSDLVSKTGCSPRHVSRLFTELVGMSFREKQVELRLTRACELLANSDFKLVDVALESGYPSASLFSLIFKQRFGISPGRWRDRIKKRKSLKGSIRRLHAAA